MQVEYISREKFELTALHDVGTCCATLPSFTKSRQHDPASMYVLRCGFVSYATREFLPSAAAPRSLRARQGVSRAQTFRHVYRE